MSFLPYSGPSVVNPTVTLGLTALIPLVRWVLHTSCFQPLCRYMLGRKARSSSSGGGKQLPLTEEKACESCWKLVVYTGFVSLGCAAMYGEPWVTNTSLLWLDWPHHDITPAISLLYNMELSFYISSVFMILLWEVRRRDFAAMFTHHLVTVALVATSMQMRFWRVGTIIMVLHDANDVLMEAAKLFKYFGYSATSTAVFVGFMASWAVTRLTLFPFVVVRSTLYDSFHLVDDEYELRTYYMFNALLMALFCLHCYWFTLIMKVAWRSITTGEADDVRED